MNRLSDAPHSKAAFDASGECMNSWAARLPLRTSFLKAGLAIFKTGDVKNEVFRVEVGSIGIYSVLPSRSREFIQEMTAGTFFGLGFLDEHVHDAIAISDSVVTCWSKECLPFLEAEDPSIRQRRAIETEREFLHRKKTLVASAPTTGHGRLAGFLTIAYDLNTQSGRDPSLIDDDVKCASVAAFLNLDILALQQALVALRDRGLVACEPSGGLRIIDLGGLKSMANDENEADHGTSGATTHPFRMTGS